MGRILSTAIALPRHRIDRDDYRRRCEAYFAPAGHARAARAIIEGTHIDTRYCVRHPDDVPLPRSLAEQSADYARHALALTEEVARRALDRGGRKPETIDLLVTCSCTGIMIPSVEAYLVERMGFRRDVVRLPITELGCAAGAASLARAREHLMAYPSHTALVIAVELPSLTFQPRDLSLTNLVATSLFGDGAAAALMGSGPSPRPSPRLIDSATHLFVASQHLMGFELKDGGFHIVLDKGVPAAIDGRVRPLAESLLQRHGLRLEELQFCVLHPGGRKILENLERELGVRAFTEPSWTVLRRFGNLSSATVLFVLDELLQRPAPPEGSYGLLAAFGPGFSCEMSLLRWES